MKALANSLHFRSDRLDEDHLSAFRKQGHVTGSAWSQACRAAASADIRLRALHPFRSGNPRAHAAPGRRSPDRGQPEGFGGDQVSDAIDLVTRRVLCRRPDAVDARPGNAAGRRATATHRGQYRRGLCCGAAEEIRVVQHAHLPADRADAG
ncbi:hypothetical protein D9M70_527200 [compost metagenome]